MFSHVMVGSNDIAASTKFYDAVFAALDVKPGRADPSGRVFWRSKTGTFAISKPLDGRPASAANGATIGFVCDSPAKVDAWHAAGIAAGGTTCENPPGWRDMPIGRFYLAYLRDPAGNKICALHSG
jgi:catechol 2,3-dioxygenase-like lactoylglutathione lyase family enzyme